jgi:hypothetical protein
MRRQGEPPEVVAMKARWCRWVEVVELFARRRAGRRRIDVEGYAVLYKELIQDCRALAESANEVEASFYRYLEDLVRPWMDPGVLARSDRDILLDLLVRCRQAERQLGIRTWLRSIPDWAPRALVMSLVAAAGITLFVAGAGGWLAALDRLRGWSDDVWFAVRNSSDVERLCVIGIVMTIVSIFTVQRTARS